MSHRESSGLLEIRKRKWQVEALGFYTYQTLAGTGANSIYFFY